MAKNRGSVENDIGGRVLLYLSRFPESNDYRSDESEWTTDNALSILVREYPNFQDLIFGTRVVDFGCGLGYQSVALAMKYDCSVLGIETNKNALQKAIDLARSKSIPGAKLLFVDSISDDMKGKFDVVISQNSFEHFNDPVAILNEMRELLTESGKLLITFGPPWFAPYGSHMHFFCRVPWINIIFSEKTVMQVRRQFRDDGATRFEDVESGLNKMSVAKFERIISSSGLKIEYKKYSCVKGVNLLAILPMLRELFINHISVILVNAI